MVLPGGFVKERLQISEKRRKLTALLFYYFRYKKKRKISLKTTGILE